MHRAVKLAIRSGLAGVRRRSFTTDSTLKSGLLDHLLHRTYVKLAPSRIAGVGVLALCDIPPETNPFTPPNQHLRSAEPPCIALRESEIAHLPTAVRAQLHSFFAAIDDPRDPTGATRLRDESGGLVYGVNATGMEPLDVSWFVNHSEEPNVRYVESEAEGAFNHYVTMRHVCAGEELVTDYRALCSELYARTVATSTPRAAAERRERLADELRAAEAAVRQLRRELALVSDGTT